MEDFIVAYDERSVRNTLVIRAYELLHDDEDGRETELGSTIQSAIEAGLCMPQYVNGNIVWKSGPSANPADLASMFERIDQIIERCPRISVPGPIVAFAAARESNAYNDVIINGQGALDRLDPRGQIAPQFIALDGFAKSLFEIELDDLTERLALTLPLTDFQRIQRRLTADLPEFRQIRSESLSKDTLRLWLPSTDSDLIRTTIFDRLRASIPAKAREDVTKYLVQGFGRTYLGNEDLETLQARVTQLTPSEFGELHHAIGREIRATKQATLAIDHDERAARLAQSICYDDTWQITRNFLAPAKSAARKATFPARPPFADILNELLARKPEELQRFEANLNAQINSNAKDVMNYAETLQRERNSRVVAAARRGDARSASQYGRNLSQARAQGIDGNLQRQLISDALSGKSGDAYAEEIAGPLQIAETAYGRIASAPTLYHAKIRHAIADEIRRSIPRDETGLPTEAVRMPRIYLAGRDGDRYTWESAMPGERAAAQDGLVTGVVTALYGISNRGQLRNYISALRGPITKKGVEQWPSAFPDDLESPLLAVLQPVTIPRDLPTVARLLRQGYGQDAALEAVTVAFSKYLRDLRDSDDRGAVAALLRDLNSPIEPPLNKKAFQARWCDQTASDLAIQILDGVLSDNTGRYTPNLPPLVRDALRDAVFARMDPDTLRDLARVDEQTKYLVDLSAVRSAYVERLRDASEVNMASTNYNVYGTHHVSNATPVSSYDAILGALGKSAYVKDTVAVNLQSDGTISLSLTNAMNILERRSQRQRNEAFTAQTLTQDDYLRTLRDRIEDTLAATHKLTFRYATPTSVYITKEDQDALQKFRRALGGTEETLTTGVDEREDIERGEDHNDGENVIENNVYALNSANLDLYDRASLDRLRAGTFRPSVTITLHPPEALPQNTTIAGHVLHSDRITTAIIQGTAVYPLPTSSLGTVLAVGSHATVHWRNEDSAIFKVDPNRFSPDLGALTQTRYTNVKDIISHERAALRVIIEQNQHEHGPIRAMTPQEIGNTTQRLTLTVIGGSEQRGYYLAHDPDQRAVILPTEQTQTTYDVGDTVVVDLIPHAQEGYRIRPIERIAQPQNDPVNFAYEQAMDNVARIHIAQRLNLEPDRITFYTPEPNAHTIETRVVYSSTDMTYFHAAGADGPVIIKAPTFGRLEAQGELGDPDMVAKREGFDPLSAKSLDQKSRAAREIISMNAMGERHRNYNEQLGALAIPPVPEVLAAIEQGGARISFEKGRITALEPVLAPDTPRPTYTVFNLNATLGQIIESQQLAADPTTLEQMRFHATVAHAAPTEAVLAAEIDGRTVLTPIDTALLNDPNRALENFREVELTFDQESLRYTVSPLDTRESGTRSAGTQRDVPVPAFSRAG